MDLLLKKIRGEELEKENYLIRVFSGNARKKNKIKTVNCKNPEGIFLYGGSLPDFLREGTGLKRIAGAGRSIMGN